jgi:hypothetical protein
MLRDVGITQAMAVTRPAITLLILALILGQGLLIGHEAHHGVLEPDASCLVCLQAQSSAPAIETATPTIAAGHPPPEQLGASPAPLAPRLPPYQPRAPPATPPAPSH